MDLAKSGQARNLSEQISNADAKEENQDMKEEDEVIEVDPRSVVFNKIVSHMIRSMKPSQKTLSKKLKRKKKLNLRKGGTLLYLYNKKIKV